jgi:hypothetical protein
MANAKNTEKSRPTDGQGSFSDEREQRAEAGAIGFKGIDGQGPKDDKIDSEAVAQLLKLSVAELRDRLEAEIVRHERCFEDFTGQVCKARPALTPMQLHERRLFAVTVQQNTNGPAEYVRHAVARLAEVEFVYPVEKAAGGSSPEDAK